MLTEEYRARSGEVSGVSGEREDESGGRTANKDTSINVCSFVLA